MSRTWKRFFYKIRMPVFIISGLLAVSSAIHIVTDQFGSSFTEVFAAVLLALVYIFGILLFVSPPIMLLLETYEKARAEIEQENEQILRALKND